MVLLYTQSIHVTAWSPTGCVTQGKISISIILNCLVRDHATREGFILPRACRQFLGKVSGQWHQAVPRGQIWVTVLGVVCRRGRSDLIPMISEEWGQNTHLRMLYNLLQSLPPLVCLCCIFFWDRTNLQPTKSIFCQNFSTHRHTISEKKQLMRT